MSGKSVFFLCGLILVFSHGIPGVYYVNGDDCPQLNLSTSNEGDVYIIIEVLVALAAAQACIAKQAPDTSTPLGLLASKLTLINCDLSDDDSLSVFVFNKVNGRLTVATTMSEYREFTTDFNAVLSKLGVTSLDTPFNELVGFEKTISPTTKAVFTQFGNIYAEYLGIGPCSETSVLTNLNAMVPIASVLQLLPSYTLVNKDQLKTLAKISNIHALLSKIGQTSVILNAYGKSHQSVDLHDNLYPIRTESGYIISNLLGQTDYTALVSDGVQCLVKSFSGSVPDQFLVVALKERALDQNFGTNNLSLLYADIICAA